MIMEPKHSAEMSKHLEKQNQALMGTYRAMSHELHKLQVEEEAIMRKLYELIVCRRSPSKAQERNAFGQRCQGINCDRKTKDGTIESKLQIAI